MEYKIITTDKASHGLKISFYEDDTYIGRHTQHQGIEIPETNLFKSLITDRTLVIDVGANIGWYSLVAAKIMQDKGWKGQCLAFEPESTNYELLERNLAQNGQLQFYVQSFKFALGEARYDTKIYLCKKGDKFLNRGDHCIGAVSREFSEDIEVHPLDAVLSLDEEDLQNYTTHILKIDVQGYEYKVLQGAERYLETFRGKIHMLLEFNDWWNDTDQDLTIGKEHLTLVQKYFKHIDIIGGKSNITNLGQIVQHCQTMKHTHANLYCHD